MVPRADILATEDSVILHNDGLFLFPVSDIVIIHVCPRWMTLVWSGGCLWEAEVVVLSFSDTSLILKRRRDKDRICLYFCACTCGLGTCGCLTLLRRQNHEVIPVPLQKSHTAVNSALSDRHGEASELVLPVTFIW